jgi:hypothetical protein
MKSLIRIIIRVASGELSKELAFREFRNNEGMGQPPRFFIGDYTFARSPKNEESDEYFQLQTTTQAESLEDSEIIEAKEQIAQWLEIMISRYKWKGDVLIDIPHWEEWITFKGTLQ